MVFRIFKQLKVIEIYVYNSESDFVRVATLMPTSSWRVGGGLLGAEVGTGYLHRLPQECRKSIGQSVERKVLTPPESKAVPVMEPHLEMEIEEGSATPEEVSKQPHELGNVIASNGASSTHTPTQLQQGATDEKFHPDAQLTPTLKAHDVSWVSNGTDAEPQTISSKASDHPIMEKQLVSEFPSPPKMNY